MTIWVLALILLLLGAAAGMRQGVILTAFSFLGIVIATLFAAWAGSLLKPLLFHLGIVNPVLIWITAPITGFVIVWMLIKAAGFEAHRRINIYYKYKAGDLEVALWKRFNLRVGACLGVVNGTAWLILISFLIFNFSYGTAQVAPSDNQTFRIRFLNQMGHDLQSTGLDKAANAVGSVPDTYYRTADFVGLLAQNPGLTSRLGNYPALISLAERDDIQQLVQDNTLGEQIKDGAPLGAILSDPQVQAVLKDTNLTATIWTILQNNMDDITNYLISSKSPKFDSEKIVGRWNFDLVPALADLRRAQPKIRPDDMRVIRALWTEAFADTTFVAGTDGQAFLKNLPDLKTQPAGSLTWKGQTLTWQGQWSGGDTDYDLTLTANDQTKTATAKTDGLRLTIQMGDATYVFERAE